MKKYFDRVITVPGIPIDSGYKSHYSHFNTLLTCNFINAYKLINYDKVCIIESDMIITENISDIFNLPVPSTYFLNNNSHDPTIDSPINGGILLFKPSWYAWYKSLSLLPDLIAINAKYPNEELFIRTWKHINQLPQRYNYSHYLLRKIKQTDKLPTIVHLHETKWKALDIIRNNYTNKFSAKIRVVKYFSKNFYEKYNKEIEAIIIEAQKLAIMHN
jgi:alpha-N-acetylglucosamine transferase